jgi:hypothetical protein
MSPEDQPEGLPEVGPTDQPSQEGPVAPLESLTTLGLRLVRACRYAYQEQGVSIQDLLWMLHGVMGQVLSWGYR